MYHELDGVSSKSYFIVVWHEGEHVFERWVKIHTALDAACVLAFRFCMHYAELGIH